MAEAEGVAIRQNEHKALVTKTRIDHTFVVLAKPTTYMNRSGDSVSNPDGPTFRIFSFPGFLLVPRSEYSHSLASYWSHVRNMLIPWLTIYGSKYCYTY